MGEGGTIVNYPDQIEALVASGQDPVEANLDELQALISPDGWHPSVETQLSELEALQPSTLLVGETMILSAGSTQPARQFL